MAYSIPLEVFEEGQQAEEYLKNKRARKEEAERSKEEKYIYDKEGNLGPRHPDNVTKKALEGIEKDPKNKKAVTMSKYRSEYGDVMPSVTKGEKEMAKQKRRVLDADQYAKNMVYRNFSRHADKETPGYGEIYNAARKHYLKTHKESFSLFENVLFI